MKNFIKNNKLTVLILALALIGIMILSVVGGLLAKYITERRLTGKISISGQLAESVDIFEHTVVRGKDGTYTFKSQTEEDEIKQNSYVLMPGVDVAKDPFVKVIKFSGVESWLYVEVVESQDFPTTVTYEIEAGWEKVTGITGPNGGTVYAKAIKTGMTDDKVVFTTESNETVTVRAYVLKNNQLIVSDQLDRDTNASLTFNAFIVQRSASDSTAADDYNTAFTASTTSGGN